MKLHSSQPWRGFFSSKVLFYSTKALTTSSSNPVDSLFQRISQASAPQIPIVPILDQWVVEEGREIKQSELHKLVKKLRKYQRFNHALRLSEWMISDRNHHLSTGDIAVQLQLISKVYGLEQAEKYFSSIEESSRNYKVYGALLKCYVEDKNLEKAEAIMEKIREIGFTKTSQPYNVMLSLYSHFGNVDKLGSLMQEMDMEIITHDRFTYNFRMHAYAAAHDIRSMGHMLMKMEHDPRITMDWLDYYVAAKRYFNILEGLLNAERYIDFRDKLLFAAMGKSEALIRDKKRWFAYECHITLYAAFGKKDEVYRIWNLYTNMNRRYNSGYLCMISSLMKLDDIDGAEKILKEWESADTSFDYRIPNMMIKMYCKKGLVDKAEAYINRLMESGKEPQASTWDQLGTGYRVNGQMTKAVETMKKAILASESGWKPNCYTLAECLEQLKRDGSIEEAEEIIRLIRRKELISTIICDGLEDYIHSENSTSSALHQLNLDGQNETDDDASNGNKHDIYDSFLAEDNTNLQFWDLKMLKTLK